MPFSLEKSRCTQLALIFILILQQTIDELTFFVEIYWILQGVRPFLVNTFSDPCPALTLRSGLLTFQNCFQNRFSHRQRILMPRSALASFFSPISNVRGFLLCGPLPFAIAGSKQLISQGTHDSTAKSRGRCRRQKQPVP